MHKQCHEWWQQTQALVFNCITVLIHVQKLIFEKYPSSQTSKDDNKLVKDSNNFIVVVIPRAGGNSRNCYLPWKTVTLIVFERAYNTGVLNLWAVWTFWSRLVGRTGTNGPRSWPTTIDPIGGLNRDQRLPFSPGSCHELGPMNCLYIPLTREQSTSLLCFSARPLESFVVL